MSKIDARYLSGDIAFLCTLYELSELGKEPLYFNKVSNRLEEVGMKRGTASRAYSMLGGESGGMSEFFDERWERNPEGPGHILRIILNDVGLDLAKHIVEDSKWPPEKWEGPGKEPNQDTF